MMERSFKLADEGVMALDYCSVSLGIILGSFHLLAKAERSHVGPDLFNVCQALWFGTRFTCITPSKRILAVNGPDGVLFLVIYNDFVYCGVFLLISVHVSLLTT